jgi:cytochrome c556
MITMVRKLTRVYLAFVLGAAAVALAVGPVVSADDKALSIKEIMAAGHKGDTALMAKVAQASKAGKWDDAQKFAKKLAENGTVLSKGMPKRGDAKSWDALAKKYADNTQAIADATEKKDAAATKTALGGLGASCKECHTAHRGK